MRVTVINIKLAISRSLVVLVLASCSETHARSTIAVNIEKLDATKILEIKSEFKNYVEENSFLCNEFDLESRRMWCDGVPPAQGSLTIKFSDFKATVEFRDSAFTITGRPTVSEYHKTALKMLFGYLKNFEIMEATTLFEDGTIRNIDFSDL